MSVSAWIVLRRVFPVVAACVSLTSASIAHAASEDWPQFWRGRSSPETSALLDEVYASTTGCGGIVAMCERAINELQNLLNVSEIAGKEKSDEIERSLPGWDFLVVLLSSLEQLYRETGQHAQAVPFSKRSLAIAEKVLGPEHPNVGVRSMSLAFLYRSMGLYSQALPLYQRSLAILEKALGPENPYAATSLGHLAELYRDTGQYEQALPISRRSLAILEKELGPDHPYVAAGLNNLALLYKAIGKYEQALPLFQRFLSIIEKSSGSEHPEFAMGLGNLAELYRDTGQYEQALPISRRSLAILEKQLVPDHPYVATGLNNLALLYKATRKYEQALPLFQRSLSITEKSVGAEHPEFAMGLRNLAKLYQVMGRYAEALPLYQRSLTIQERALGPEHPNVAAILDNLAELYRVTGQYDRALPLYQRSLSVAEKALGPENRDVATYLNDLATLYQESGQYARALPLYERSLSISEKALGPEHPDVAASLNNLAVLLRITGQYAQALQLSQRCLAILERALGPEHPDLAVGLSTLTGLYRDTGQYAQAVSLSQRTVAILEKVLGPEHPDVAAGIGNLAVVYGETGQYAKALPLAQRSLAIREKKFGREHPLVAVSLDSLAELYRLNGQYAQALPLHQRSLAIEEKVFGADHPEAAASLLGLAQLYWDSGKYVQALPMLHRAEQIAARSGTPESAWGAQFGLQLIYGANGQPQLATFWGKRAVNTLQRLRAGLMSLDRGLQKGFLQNRKTAYRNLVDLLIDQGRLPEAQQTLAILKEEERLDYVQRNSERDPRGMSLVYTKFEQPWVEKYEREGAALGKLGAEYQSLARINAQVRTQEQTARLKALGSELALAQKKYETFMEELKVAFTPESKPPVEVSAKDTQQLKGLQQQLADLGRGAVAVQYLVTKTRVRILVTTSQDILHRDSAITEKDLNASVNRYRQVLENPKLDPFADAQNLYKHLLEPIEADLRKANARLLMVSFDGRLRYLPIAALHDGKQWVAEKYAVAIYTPVARSNLRQQPRAQWRVAGFGVSDGGDGMNPLTYVPFELEDIIRRNGADKNGVVAGEIYLNGQVREDVLAQVIQQQSYPVLHIASHFKFTLGGTLADSYLLLGQGKRLTLEQFSLPRFAMKGVDLLVLSACQTAMEGATQDGREIEGFGNLAQAQGAQAVLATQWSVNDQSTAQLMREFYAQREAKQLTKAEALQKAQLSLVQGHTGAVTASNARQPAEQRGQPIRDGVLAQAAFTPSATAPYAHPYYWAPFILMGNWL